MKTPACRKLDVGHKTLHRPAWRDWCEQFMLEFVAVLEQNAFTNTNDLNFL